MKGLVFQLRSVGRRRARLLALAVSLLVHAALTLLLVRSPGSPLAPPEIPLQIEIVESPAADPVAPLAAEDPHPDPGGPAPAQPARPAAPRRRASQGAPSAPANPGTQPEPAPVAESRGTLLQMRAPEPLALVPSYDTLDRMTRDGVIAAPDPSVTPAVRPRGPTFMERLAERQRQDAGRATVESGKVHPQMYDFLRDARRGFTPAALALDSDPRAPNTVGRSLKQWGKGVGQAYRSWKRKVEDSQKLRLDHDPNRRGAPDILKHYNRMMNGTETAAEPMDCMVCLVVRPGAAPEVVMSSSSGNSEVDRAAMEALRQSANTRPLEKDVPAQKSCYRFRATVHRIPPLPIVGCGFDEATLTAGCYYPTMKVRKTSVTLESVDYDG